jgi:hypothetical protein
MANSEPKRHHFVPQFYLRRWSTDGKVAVRRRDGRQFLSSVEGVGAINGFYDFETAAGQVSKDVEKYFASEVEAPAATALGFIDEAHRPPSLGSDERRALSRYVAFQMTRTPERRAQVLFAEHVRSFLVGRELTKELMEEFLETEHLGVVPQPSEVQGAFDFAGHQLATIGVPSKEEAMQILLDVASQMAAVLELRHWSLAVDRKRRFITADQPVALWHPPSERDAYQGVGLMEAPQIRWPLDPGHCLLVSKTPRPEVTRLTPTEVRSWNQHAARKCNEYVIGEPSRATPLNEVELHARGPRIRFNNGPLIERDHNGQRVTTDKEILHMWVENG